MAVWTVPPRGLPAEAWRRRLDDLAPEVDVIVCVSDDGAAARGAAVVLAAELGDDDALTTTVPVADAVKRVVRRGDVEVVHSGVDRSALRRPAGPEVVRRGALDHALAGAGPGGPATAALLVARAGGRVRDRA